MEQIFSQIEVNKLLRLLKAFFYPSYRLQDTYQIPLTSYASGGNKNKLHVISEYIGY